MQAIIDAEKRGDIKSAKIELVLSNNPSAYALERAERAGIKAVAINKKLLSSQAEFEEKICSVLKEHDIEMIVLAGFMCILTENFTSKYPERIINIHPSLIPSFCGKGYYGLKVHEAALSYGVKVTGATVHYVNEIPDGGKIIAQRAVEVKEGDTPEILQRRVMEQAEWKILPEACEKTALKLLEEKKRTEEKNNEYLRKGKYGRIGEE